MTLIPGEAMAGRLRPGPVAGNSARERLPKHAKLPDRVIGHRLGKLVSALESPGHGAW
jgi:hypothetical protein